MQSAVLLGVGMRFVAGVDDRTRARGRRRDTFPDVFRTLREAERRGLRRLQHLAGAADQLARDEERQQDIRNAGELTGARDEKVLVAAVRVSGRVGVVLEEIDVATNTLLGESRLGVDQQFFEHTLTGTVVIDQLDEAVALGRRVLRVRTHIQVQAGSVTEEDVGAATPRHDTTEEVTSNLVGAQSPVPVKGAGNAEFRLDTHDSSLHTSTVQPECEVHPCTSIAS